MIEKQEKPMHSKLAYIMDLKDLAEANEEFALINENTGYDPYNNPGTHKEVRDETE